MLTLKRLSSLMPRRSPTLLAASTVTIENPLGSGNDNLLDILKNISGAILDLAIPVAAAMYIYAGFLWLTAGAKIENVTKAKTVFKFTTIGLIVIFIGGGFVDLIRSILNLGN